MGSAVLFLFFVAVSGVNCAVIYNDQVEISGREGKCYDKNAKIFYNKGDLMTVDENECAQRKCLGFLQETGKLRVETLTCPAVKAGPGCSIIQDPNKPYPDCCPQLVSIPSAQPVSCDQPKREHI